MGLFGITVGSIRISRPACIHLTPPPGPPTDSSNSECPNTTHLLRPKPAPPPRDSTTIFLAVVAEDSRPSLTSPHPVSPQGLWVAALVEFLALATTFLPLHCLGQGHLSLELPHQPSNQAWPALSLWTAGSQDSQGSLPGMFFPPSLS